MSPPAQEILALTGGGASREYTEVRPDGTTVTYTVDVEEEEFEVSTGRSRLDKRSNNGVACLRKTRGIQCKTERYNISKTSDYNPSKQHKLTRWNI